MSNRAFSSETNLLTTQADAMVNERALPHWQNAFNPLDLLKEGRGKVYRAFEDVASGHSTPAEKVTVGVVTAIGVIAAVATAGVAVEAGAGVAAGAAATEGAAAAGTLAAGAATEGAAVVETVASGAGGAGGVELAPMTIIGPGGRIVATGAKDVAWVIADAVRKAAGGKHYLP